ncbi:MAG: hypothetical protein HXX19_09795 [Rhodoferax sp.]|nr:hypothetical protein [Rhodoferax sp.]
MTLEARRQAEQLAFVASQAELEVGSLADFPMDATALQNLQASDPCVEAVIDSGLTARVLRLCVAGGRWTLKQARAEARVRNVDGQTSFLNEVQRRADLAQLQSGGAADPRWAGLVRTVYASFRKGVILSPWIEGRHIDHWDARQLRQVLELACALWLEGLFEWDLCRGNLLDDGHQVQWFDFGYMYRFDPLRQFSSAGNGSDVPLFHPAERFETRCLCAALLALEQSQGTHAALALFRMEKEIALEVYTQLRTSLAARGGSARVLAWLDGITGRWAQALRGDLASLYLAENWRSHVLDLDDDLRGQSCTPLTLRRADWLLAALQQHEGALRAQQALFWGDEGRDAAALHAKYQDQRRAALHFQLGEAAGS